MATGQEMGAARDELRDVPHQIRDRVTGEVRRETMIINMGPQHQTELHDQCDFYRRLVTAGP